MNLILYTRLNFTGYIAHSKWRLRNFGPTILKAAKKFEKRLPSCSYFSNWLEFKTTFRWNKTVAFFFQCFLFGWSLHQENSQQFPELSCLFHWDISQLTLDQCRCSINSMKFLKMEEKLQWKLYYIVNEDLAFKKAYFYVIRLRPMRSN